MKKDFNLSKIKSKHILNQIFDFIKDDNFKLKFLKYSKYFQKIFDINIFNYQNAYFKKSNFYLPDFLNNKSEKIEEFDKDFLQKKLDKFLIKHPQLSISDINKYVKEFIPLYAKKEQKENNEQGINYEKSYNNYIDIYSPFFELISKNEFFGNIFTINIPTNLIVKKSLENIYITIFDDLEKNNINYYSLKISLNDIKDLDVLNKFKIKFNQLNKIIFDILEKKPIINYNTFLDKIFSFFSKENTLKYLNLEIPNESQNIIDNTIISKINNFQHLEHLLLKNFIIQNPFILDLPKLKYLNIDTCENIGFAENSLLNIEKIYITSTEIIKAENAALIKLPKATDISIVDEGDFIYNTIFDFSSFQNIKNLVCNKHDFPSLTNFSLEKLTVSFYNKEDKEMEKQMIEKILLMKDLKILICCLSVYANDALSEIKGENPSVEKITIIKENICEEHVINNFINLFPNAYDLNLNAINSSFDLENLYLMVKEDPNSKIKSFQISIDINNCVLLNCAPYEELTNVEFNIREEIIALKNAFPIFRKQCDVIFKSLVSFKFIIRELNLNRLQRIYNNLDKMPNLESFTLKCVTNNIPDDYYKKIIEKLLKMNLKTIELSIKKEPYEEDIYYSKDELLSMFKDVELNNFEQIKIHKPNNGASLSQLLRYAFNDYDY